MEPLEIVGAVAAVGQLLELCIKAGKTSTQLVQSFINAPTELRNLSAKLASLQMIIQQFQALGQDLLMTGVEDILPATHKDMLLSSLLASERALKNLTTLHNTAGQSSTPKPGCNFSRRLLWSLIDKKRSTVVIEELRKAEMVLDTVILILNTRLNSHIWTSFSAMQLAQQAFRADFLQSARDVKTIVEAQHYTISEFKANADHTLLSILQSQTENDTKVQGLVSSHEQLSDDLSKLRENIANQEPASAQAMPRPISDIPQQRADSAIRKTRDISSLPRQHAPQPATERVFSKVEQLMTENDWKKHFARYHWFTGPDDQLFGITVTKPCVGGMVVALLSKKNERRAHAKFRARLKILGQRIFQFEIKARQFARTWMSLPGMNCAITIINIRPTSAPIFQACYEWDMVTVKHLLESGEASVNDVDHETRRGLLEHLFRTTESDQDKSLHSPFTKFRGGALLRYLLDRGCDPNVFNGSTGLPAVLFAFGLGFSRSVSSLLFHGADLESFQSRPADLIDAVAHRRYKWQLKLLHSVGFSDWNPTRQSSMSLLHAAAYYNDIPMLLFGMGAIGIDPNTGDNYMTPLHEAAMGNNVLAGSMLREACADINSGHGVWGGTPLQRCMDFKAYEMGHWLLQCGANTNISDSLSNDVWTGFWERIMTRVVGRNHDVCFDFLREEAMLTHLLLHDSDPHQLFRTVWIQHFHHGIGFFRAWYDYCGHIQTPEVARACSYRIRGLLFYPSGSDENGSALCGFPKEVIIQYEDAEHTRRPARTSLWCSRGHIYLAERDTPNDVGSDRDSDSDNSLESSDDDTDSGSEDGDCDCRKQHRSYNDRDSGSSLCNCDVDGGDNQNVRPGITLFYDTISTPEGQLRMSRFPFVCLLTNALCMAGYRAEMDEDGDIWYEDENGDSYHDAREFQPHEDEDDGLARNCPMCQNPDKYGLGHIFEEAERGRNLLLEYRARAKTQKRTYF